MTPRPISVAVDTSGDLEPPRALASWYTEGSSDGLGDRLLMFDNSSTPSLELLRFRPALARAIGFEDALRERVDRLRAFDHPAFPQARAVERLDRGGDLALVSTFTAGKRLGEIFRSARTRSGVHPAFAAWLIRDLTSALADLHRQGDGVTHGGLTPDRVVLTADGRLVIVEHVLGGALDSLQLPAARMWHELGIMTPEAASGAALLDKRTDVVQLGWIVLSVLVGRRITPAEYPQHLDSLFDEFARTSGRRAPALVPALRGWLERALRLNGDIFESAIDAHQALRELGEHSGPRAIAYMARRDASLAHDAPPQLSIVTSAPPPQPEAPPPHLTDESEVSLQHSEPELEPMPITPEYAADLRLVEPSIATPPASQRVRIPRRLALGWVVAAALAVCALVEGVAIRRLSARAPAAAPPPAAQSIVFESLEPGDPVIVDGRQIGVTPLEVKVGSGMRAIRVQSRGTPAAEAAPAVQPPAVVDAAAATIARAAARERRGGLRLSAPIEVQVVEGERVLGSSADGPIVTTAGRHELDFINSAVGYRSRQVVDIKPGQIVTMAVSLPDGRLSINAVPWAQVWINGNLAGETPLANLPLPVGEHQVTFRHPQLGEQTQKVVVRSAALTRVSATFGR